MEKITALRAHQRTQIIKSLTADQVRALNEFTRYAMLSQFHTNHYLRDTDWEFQGIVIDPLYHLDHAHRGQNLYCDCGRRLKNQFILRSWSTGHRLALGISHFQQHASIPETVIKEIKRGINEIDLYRDAILIAYARGQRFPHQAFDYVQTHRGFANREASQFYQRCLLFSQVNLPLFPNDYRDLMTLVKEVRAGHRHRLSKEEVQQIVTAIAEDWRSLNRQLTLYEYQLTQAGLTNDHLHRLQLNALNYALRRHKSRFVVHDWKAIRQLNLTKARTQQAIILRQLAFYWQVTVDCSPISTARDQLGQVLISHQQARQSSRLFAVQEGRQLVQADLG